MSEPKYLTDIGRMFLEEAVKSGIRDAYHQGYSDAVSGLPRADAPPFGPQPEPMLQGYNCQPVPVTQAHIDLLRLPYGITNRLKENGIRWVHQLLQLSEPEVESFRQVGNMSVRRIQKKLKEFGLELRTE